jgi:hypothetical protein
MSRLGSAGSLVGLELDETQMRQGHWAVVDVIGKGGHIRTLPIGPDYGTLSRLQTKSRTPGKRPF